MFRKWWQWWKKLKIALRNGKIYLAHGLAKSVLLKWPYHPRKFLEILTIAFFIELKQIILKFVWKHTHTKPNSFSPVQFSHSVMSDYLWPMKGSMPGFLVHHQLPEFTQTHVHWFSDAIQPSHPRSSPSPPAPIPPSIRVFSKESTLHMRWPKYWSFSFSINPSSEHPGLI